MPWYLVYGFMLMAEERLASSSSKRSVADFDAVFNAKCVTADSDATCVQIFDALPLWFLQMWISPLMD